VNFDSFSRMTRWSALLSVSLLAPAHAAEQAPVTTQAAQSWPAVLDWAQRVTLSLPQSGVVTQVHAAVGERVAAKQLLLTLDPRRFQADIQAAQAILKRAQVQREEAQRQLTRTQSLHDQTLIASHELQLAKDDLTAAAAAVENAQAGLLQAKLSLEESQLRAPFAGLVLDRTVEPGQAVINRCQAQALLTLVNPEQMLARAHLDAQQWAQLKPKQAMTVQFAGASYPGTVQTLGLEPLPNSEPPRYLLSVAFAPKTAVAAGLPAQILPSAP